MIAYHEHSAPDPMSGAAGMLRQEWRIQPVQDFDSAELRDAFGNLVWATCNPPTHVLMHRYVRRGVEEPWTLYEHGTSHDMLLGYVPDNAIATLPALRELQKCRAQTRETKRLDDELRAQLRAEKETRLRKRDRSQAAFLRLRNSKDGEWAKQWNLYCSSADVDEQKRVAGSLDLMRLYHAAMDAETVPTKRSAIKRFLAAVG